MEQVKIFWGRLEVLPEDRISVEDQANKWLKKHQDVTVLETAFSTNGDTGAILVRYRTKDKK